MSIGQAAASITLVTTVVLTVLWVAADGLTGGIAGKVCPDATIGAYLRCLEVIHGFERMNP